MLNTKHFKLFFLIALSVLTVQLLFGLALPVVAEDVQFQPQVDVGPGFSPSNPITVPHNTGLLADYIRTIYNWGIGAVGIVAALGMIIGGLIWLTAGGNMSKVGEAKAWIGSSLLGLLLALGAYAILKTINPDLVNLKITQINVVNGPDLPEFQNRPYKENIIGCCGNEDAPGCTNTIHSHCSGIFYPQHTCNDKEACVIKTEEEIACAGKKQYDLCTTKNINKGYCDNPPNPNPLANEKFYGTFNGSCQPCKNNGEACNNSNMCCSGICSKEGFFWTCQPKPNPQDEQIVYCSFDNGAETYCIGDVTRKYCLENLKGRVCDNGCKKDGTCASKN